MQSGLAAFRFALVGFALPYCFVLSPELLLLSPDGGPLDVMSVIAAVCVTGLGVVPLAAAVTGRFRGKLRIPARFALLVSSGLLLFARNTADAWTSVGIGIMVSCVVLYLPTILARRSV